MDRASNTSLHQNRHRNSVPRGRRYLALGLILVFTLFAASTSQPALPASATADDEAQFVAALNQVRAGVGLPALTVNSEMVGLARQHAQVMADAGHIFHANPISAGYTGPWAKFGENVGVGGNVSVLVDAFVASPGHYANIVDPAFTQIGVGVVWSGNSMYTTHRFLQLPTTPTITVPPTTSPSTTAPPATAPPPTSQPPAVTEPPTTTQPPDTKSPTPSTTTTSVSSTPSPSTSPSTTTSTRTPTPDALPMPQVLPERIVELVKMVELVGT